jgi:hypothetical protein
MGVPQVPGVGTWETTNLKVPPLNQLKIPGV